MSDKNILQVNESELDRKIKHIAEQVLDKMLDAEADDIAHASTYERTDGRKAYHAGHYKRDFTVKAGTLRLQVPKLKGELFRSMVVSRYRRREESVDEALIDMYLAGVSQRRVDEISRDLWGTRTAPATLSKNLKDVYARIDAWRNRPLTRPMPYVFMDGVWHRRIWGAHVETVSVLVAIGVDSDGYRQVIGVAQGAREDAGSWESLIESLLKRGLTGVRLVVGDRNPGLVQAVSSLLPDALYQRCIAHFERNVASHVPRYRMEETWNQLKAIFSMDSRNAALGKAKQVEDSLRKEHLTEAANCLRNGINAATTYFEFPSKHRRLIRTNNMIERLNREIRRRTRVVGCFPDGESALMLICARIIYVTGKWGDRRYLDTSLLQDNNRKQA